MKTYRIMAKPPGEKWHVWEQATEAIENWTVYNDLREKVISLHWVSADTGSKWQYTLEMDYEENGKMKTKAIIE